MEQNQTAAAKLTITAKRSELTYNTHKNAQKSKGPDKKHKFKKNKEYNKRASDENQSGFNKKSNDKVLANVECYNCHKKRHYSIICPDKDKTSNLNQTLVTAVTDAKKEKRSPKPIYQKPQKD